MTDETKTTFTQPSRIYTFYALFIIFLANLFNYMDRMLVSATLPYITDDLRLTGGQGGLLWTAFTIGYLLSAPIVGYLSDRYRRTGIFAFCVFLWSCATAICGITQSFVQIFVARVFIGLGEAGCLIIGPVLIADYFPKSARGKAMAFFAAGMPLGATMGFVLGGNLTEILGWRTLFMIIGLSGIPIAALINFLFEPVRGAHDPVTSHHSVPNPQSRVSYLQFLKNKTLILLTLAFATSAFVYAPVIHFATSYFDRVKDYPKGLISAALVGAMFAGVLGNMAGGYLGDKFAHKNKASYSIIAGIAFLLTTPLLILAAITTTPFVMLPAVITGFFFNFMIIPTINTQVANVTLPVYRAMAFSFLIFTMHILGDTISPPIFGLAYDENPYATYALFPLILLISSLCCFLASKFARKDIEDIEYYTAIERR
jgi:predicted MFS family arabinose efflux permease